MLLLALACSSGPTDYEGDAAGECTDGADNNRDGAFDCDDPGCAASPDCDTAEADTDTASDADTDTDTDADTDSDTDTDTDTDSDTDTDTDTDSDTDSDTDTDLDPAGRWEGGTKVPGTAYSVVGDRYADSVGTALAVGDADEDGIDDLILGSPYAARPDTYDGAIWLVKGPITGDRALASADMEMDGESYGHFGQSVAFAGDLDADGHDEVAISKPQTYGEASANGPGEVFLFTGPLVSGMSLGDAAAVWTGETDDAGAGVGLTGGVDYTGDGRPDLVVGARYDDNDVGAAYILADSALSGGGLDGADVRMYGTRDGSLGFGSDVFAAGDLNGDGDADLGVGWRNYYPGTGPNSAVAFYFGPITGNPGGADADSLVTGDTDAYFLGMQGRTVVAGDVDGDGTDDLLLSATQVVYETGMACVVSGADVTAGTESRFAIAFVDGGGTYRELGSSVAAPGDVDGDGFADIVVGETGDGTYALGGGATYIFYGPMSGHYVVGDAGATWYGDTMYGALGNAALGGVELTGDTYGDLVIAACAATGDSVGSGVVYVIPGLAP